ncbi:MAG TPA: YlxR family protein [Solirubrobacteraceae bacterium]|nr:YlxR family protein [Solirubrobacteraceae bacterium]
MAREPLRRCVGCGRSAPKRELARLVVRDGVVVADPDAHAPGRGAYVHPTPECAVRGLRARPLARALRTTVTVPDELVDLFD